MRRILLLCVLLALGSFGATCVRAAMDPGDRFLEVYFLVQDGDAAERAGDGAKAGSKFSAALEVLREIQTNWPDWNPHIIEFRTKYCTEHVEALPLTPAVAAPAAPPSPAAPAPAPAVQSDDVRRLTGELQQARENIHQLQQTRDELAAKLETKLQEPAPADRTEAQQALEQLRGLETVHAAVKAKLDEAVFKAAKADELTVQLNQSQNKVRALEAERADLNGKLQAALAKTAATQTSPQIEELIKKNTELTAKLAAAQSQMDDFRRVDTEGEKIQLRAELTQVKQQLEKVQAENVELKQSRGEIMAKLTEADRQLHALKASNAKSDEIIQHLRKENALLNETTKRVGTVAKAGSTASESKGFLWWRPKQTPPAVTDRSPARELPAPVSQSATGKLVATIKAPTPAPAAKPPAPPAAAKPAAPPAPPHKVETNATKTITGPPEIRVLLNEARAAFALKDLNTAATKYEAVLAHDPNNVTALSNMGVVRFKQGKIDDAEVILRKAVAQAPNDSPSRSLLGVIYFRKGRIEEAFSELTRAVALDPRNAEAHNYLGITLNEKGWQAAAEQEIRRAIELNPQYADAHFNLAVMYTRQKTPRLELARYHYRQAIDLGAEHDPQLEAALKSAAAPKPEESPKTEPKADSSTATP